MLPNLQAPMRMGMSAGLLASEGMGIPMSSVLDKILSALCGCECYTLALRVLHFVTRTAPRALPLLNVLHTMQTSEEGPLACQDQMWSTLLHLRVSIVFIACCCKSPGCGTRLP